jgi:MerR family transcriptional regulator/heat shock protein HspR
MMPPKKSKAYYTISVVAKEFGVHPQTLRLYEREGLLKPSRTKGNTRLYSNKDLELLTFVLKLTRDMGVNLAGVEIIINMRCKMESMQEEMDSFIARLRDKLQSRRSREEIESKEALVPVRRRPGRTIKIQKG